MRIHTFDPEATAAILAGEPCSVPVPHPLAAERIAIHNGTDIVGRAYLPGAGTTTITADAIEHAADLVDGEKVHPICYPGEFVLWRDVLPTCIESVVMQDDDGRVTLRLTPEQVTAIRDALRDALIADWCDECGKERSPGGPDDDLRPQDHDPDCALWAAHVAVCEVAG